MLLRVGESTLIRPRNITTTLHFRLRGPEQLRSGDWDDRRVARYRRAAAKLNYSALDNPCLAYASKEVSWKMSDSDEPSDEKSLIRVLRYPKQSCMVEYMYKWQDPNEILLYTDIDWAGCPRTRRSTTGGAVMYGSCLVAHWSRTQVSVALSSAEASFCQFAQFKELNGSFRLDGIGYVRTLLKGYIFGKPWNRTTMSTKDLLIFDGLSEEPRKINWCLRVSVIAAWEFRRSRECCCVQCMRMFWTVSSSGG